LAAAVGLVGALGARMVARARDDQWARTERLAWLGPLSADADRGGVSAY
jgi:hypothetical protein